MFEPTGSRRDAASTIFNLPDYRVLDAHDLPEGGRRVVAESMAPPGCPACGVVSTRVHARRVNTPSAGPITTNREEPPMALTMTPAMATTMVAG